MTDGILLMEAQRDPALRCYDTIIVDEAHERSLNIDFMLGLLKTILPRRPNLRVVITSATIDTQILLRPSVAHRLSRFWGASIRSRSATVPSIRTWRKRERSLL